MKERTSKLEDLLALLVFALFSICLLAVLLTGARSYKSFVSRGEESYLGRTATQYLATRVRQGGTPEIADFGGCQALCFREELAGEIYLTRVYCFDGWLRELYSPENADLAPADGEKILKTDNLTFRLEGTLLRVFLDDAELILHLEEGLEVPG